MARTFASVSKKMGKVRPETKSIAEEVFLAAQKAGHDVWYIWGMGSSSEHRTGRALDLMVRTNAGGDFVRNYLWTHRKRLRLKHVIWEQHITSTVVRPGVREKMLNRGNSTANHYDHVHTLHFPGKYQPPPPPKPPAPAKLVVDGDLGPKTIGRWQQIMKVKVTGKITSDLVSAVQRRLKSTVNRALVVDGEVGSLDFGVERKTIEALQRYLKVPVTKKLSPENSATVKALQGRLNQGFF